MDGTHTIQCHCQLLSVNWCTYVNQFVSETVTIPPPGIAHKSGLTVVNNPQEPSTPNYVIGYTPSSEQLFSRRTAASHAGYLLPYLKAGMKVLDIGCGPGSISVGLADAVAPGELYGIDMEQSQVEFAVAAARKGGHDNARFQVGDALALPFPESYFDVVHCHTVLIHIPDTSAALAEGMRVLKRGGFLASRDMIGDLTFVEPNTGRMGEIIPSMLKLIAESGGHPLLGKEHRAKFSDAGFIEIESKASFESFGSTEEVELFACVFGEDFSQRFATTEELDEFRRDAADWKAQPGAFAGFAMAETVARKP